MRHYVCNIRFLEKHIKKKQKKKRKLENVSTTDADNSKIFFSHLL